MRAAEREAAIAAGSVWLLLSDWLEARFNLPAADVPDLRGELPEKAAVLVRRHWQLGERPIRRVLRLLESRGVRVFSLSEQTRNVDAFSFWRSERPFVFLNLFKTAEATVLDCAHEPGHLVLHRHRWLDSPRDDSENDIARELSLPLDELESLVSGHMKPARGDARAGRGRDGLAVVPQSS